MWRRLDGKFKSSLLSSSSITSHTPSLTRTSLTFSPSASDDVENQPPSSLKKLSTNIDEKLTKSNNDISNTTISFQKLINNIASKQTQDDVTVSYYFICLLHLANEKVYFYFSYIFIDLYMYVFM